jgi:hypothetical protein
MGMPRGIKASKSKSSKMLLKKLRQNRAEIERPSPQTEDFCYCC